MNPHLFGAEPLAHLPGRVYHPFHDNLNVSQDFIANVTDDDDTNTEEELHQAVSSDVAIPAVPPLSFENSAGSHSTLTSMDIEEIDPAELPDFDLLPPVELPGNIVEDSSI